MNNENIVLDENSNTSDEEVIDLDLTTEEDVVEQDEEVDVEKILADKKKAEELAHNYKIRAEKAEAKIKTAKPEPTQNSSLTVYDTIALMNAKVTEAEDIKEVEEYARFKGVSVSEALKSGVIKTILADKAEERKTAQATNTGKARVGSSTLPDEVVLKNASLGKLPDDPSALVNARFNSRRN